MNNSCMHTDDESYTCYIKLKDEKLKEMTKVSAVIFWYFCFFVYVWYINIVCVYPLKFNDVHFIIYYFIQGCGSLLLGLFSDIYGKRKCLNISFLFLIASFSTILLTISSSDFLFINNITNFNNQKYDIHSNQNVFAQDDSPNNLMHFFSPKKGNDFFDKNDNFSENKYKILNSHNNNIQDDNNYMNKSENENLSHITDIYSNNNHDQNVLSEKDKNPNNDNISNIETVNTRGDNTDDVENLTAKHGNQHTNSSNKYIEIKLKLNNNFQKLHEQLIKKVTNDIKKKNNDILNKKYINNIIQLCVKTNLKKYIMDLKNYNIGMAKNVRRKKGVITNNDNDNNNYYYYSRNYADSENSDIYMENNYDHIVNKCVDGIISMYNDGENDNYVTGQNDDLYLSNNENLQNNKPTIKFLETLFEKSDKSESKYSYIYKILFYLITFASGFFAKGISNILCIIITENIKSNYRTKGVCLIYIIENISLILIRSLFVFNTYINLFILYKINILVCIFLNIVIIILLNIYFSDINHNVLKIQKDNINKLQNHENGIENNPLPNDDDNDSNSDINDEKKKKKKKNFFSFFKKKNIDSNNSENANYDTIQVFKIDKNYNDIKRELSNDILKLKAAANIINNEESINLELMNKDMENNILDNASDLSDDISNIPNELTNKRNATDEVINILSDNSDIVSDIPNIDNSANEINETNNSKSSPKKNFKKLSTLAKINNKKIGLKKSKTIGVSYKHILNGKMLKTIDKNELLEKLNKNDEYLQYIEELKNNNLFNIYKMWVKYTFKAHTYVVWALCLLYFMFNFLYISFFVIYNIFIYDIKSQFHFYTYNNSFIVLNCVLLVFYLFLYCNLKNKIIKVLNLFGSSINYKRIDEAYFYHFLLYLSNKKIVSPHYINMAVSSEEK
ncbi:hypothetical protein YYE_03522 [Plasmodium vinckei vinckei]|uniref:Uncharacterized protein n=1 Tax=Plasmodium vinckei vinckei TaxID=54757 RepID=A0A081ICL8_PLAVN|nr:hypothetical protein YYE_03522 [Plasmodium vinckei vinckei]